MYKYKWVIQQNGKDFSRHVNAVTMLKRWVGVKASIRLTSESELQEDQRLASMTLKHLPSGKVFDAWTESRTIFEFLA